jgi:hypothetical protein
VSGSTENRKGSGLWFSVMKEDLREPGEREGEREEETIDVVLYYSSFVD